MKLSIIKSLMAATALVLSAGEMSGANEMVTVSDGQLMLNGAPYRYIGTNLWYGPILGSKGRGGDRKRLCMELDSLQALGINNLRVLAGGEGDRTRDCHIEPNLQTAPGVYDPDLLEGLDFFLAELEKRDMKAVIYLNNSWEWSGGYGSYLEWAGYGEAPLPSRDGYRTYIDYAGKFITDSAAQAMYVDHVRHIVGRTNSITGRPYSESPAIMSWQICNEPRCFNRANKEAFADWLISTGRLIKSIDPNHLVSTGSEGYNGCEVDIDLWARIHNAPEIDYANIHIWPYNWRWVTDANLYDGLPQAIAETDIYIRQHRAKTSKPIVLEEFGYPRDAMAIAPGSATEARDRYYRYVLGLMAGEDGPLAGINFWGWGGDVNPAHDTWQPGDPYTGDPAQEPQGLYSVFASDSTTIATIRAAISKLRK